MDDSQPLLKSAPSSHHCLEHSKKFEYYCQTCDKYLCSDCIFEQIVNPPDQKNQHNNHKLMKISEIVDTEKAKLTKQLSEINTIINKIEKHANTLENRKNTLTENRDGITIEMFNAFRTLQRHLDESYAEAEGKILEQAEKIEKNQESVRILVDEAEIIMNSNDPKIISNASGLLDRLKSFNPPELIDPPPSISMNWENELIPKFVTIKIDVPDFLSFMERFKDLQEADIRYVYSPEAKMYGAKWRSKIYPNGNSTGLNTHLSVFVELIEGVQGQATFVYQVELLHPSGKKGISRTYSSVFQELDSWGWNKMAPLSQIIQEGYIFDNGSLSLILSLRPESFYQASKQSKMTYDKLRLKYKQLKSEAKQLKTLNGTKKASKTVPKNAPTTESEATK